MFPICNEIGGINYGLDINSTGRSTGLLAS